MASSTSFCATPVSFLIALSIGCGTTRAEPLHQPQPDPRRFTAIEAGPGRHENVTAYCIESDGKTADISTVKSAGTESIDAIYRETIAAWRFEPARVHGKPDSECREARFRYSPVAAGQPVHVWEGSQVQRTRPGAAANEPRERLSAADVVAGSSSAVAMARTQCGSLARAGQQLGLDLTIVGATGKIRDVIPAEDARDSRLGLCVSEVLRAHASFPTFTAEPEQKARVSLSF